MVVVRRSFYIEEAEDKKVGEIARTVGVDKSEIVDLVLSKGLPELEKGRIVDVMQELVERRLRRMEKGSIKTASAKRRAK
jgi:hypothetical protein